MPDMSDQPTSDPPASDAHAADVHATDVPGHADSVAHHATDDHGEDHGHDDHGHGADAEALGPVDTFAWGAGLLGVIAGLIVVIGFVLATAGLATPV
jgi:hypothetical protein